MEETRLPKNGKEGLLYGSIICIISVTIMLILNVGTAVGFTKIGLLTIAKMIPIIFILAMLLESFVVGKISEKLVKKFTEPSDGFNTKILFNIIFTITGMSAIMTILGAEIGNLFSGTGLSLEPVFKFFEHWPRNFCVIFWCEVLLAQPMARFVMKKLHEHKSKKLTEKSEVHENYEGGLVNE